VRRCLRWVGAGLAVGVPLGYVFFYAVLPNVSIPFSVRLPLYVPAIIALGLGCLLGLILDNMEDVAVASFGSLFVGVAVASALVISPLFEPEIDSAFAGDLILDVVRMSFPVVIAAFVCLFVGGFVGQHFNDQHIPPEKGLFDGGPER
jgi:hypothetical protein